MFFALALALAFQELPPGASKALEAPLSVQTPPGLQVLDAHPFGDGWIVLEESTSYSDAELILRRFDSSGFELWFNPVLSLADVGIDLVEPSSDLALAVDSGVALVASVSTDLLTGEATSLAAAVDATSGATLWTRTFDASDLEVERLRAESVSGRFLLAGRRGDSLWFSALNGLTGETVWEVERPTQNSQATVLQADLALGDQVLGVAGRARHNTPYPAAFAMVLDTVDGSTLWEYQDPSAFASNVKLAMHPTLPRAAVAVLPLGGALPDRLSAWEWSIDQNLWNTTLPHTASFTPLTLEWSPDGARLASLHAPLDTGHLQVLNALTGTELWNRQWTGLPFQQSFLVNGLPEPDLRFDSAGQLLAQFSMNEASGFEVRYEVLDAASGAVAYAAPASPAGVDAIAASLSGPNASGAVLRCINEGPESSLSPLQPAQATYVGQALAAASPSWTVRPVWTAKAPIWVHSVERCPASGRLALVYEVAEGVSQSPALYAGVFDPSGSNLLWSRTLRTATETSSVLSEFYELRFTGDGASVQLYQQQVKAGSSLANFEWIDALTGATTSTALSADPAALGGLRFSSTTGPTGPKVLRQGRNVTADLGDRAAVVRRFANGDYHLTGYDRGTGAQLWDIDLQSGSNGSDTPHVASFEGRLYCHKPGARVWRLDPLDGALLADSPVTSGEFEALVAGDSGVLSIQLSGSSMDIRTFNQDLGFLSFVVSGSSIQGIAPLSGSAGFAVVVDNEMRQFGLLDSPVSATSGWVTPLGADADARRIARVDGGESLMLTAAAFGSATGDLWFDAASGARMGDSLEPLLPGVLAEAIPLDSPSDRAIRVAWRSDLPELIVTEVDLPELHVSASAVTVGEAGSVEFYLRGSGALSSPNPDVYWLMGGRELSEQGLVVDGIQLPFDPADPYFLATLFQANQGVFAGTLGALGSGNNSTAELSVPSTLDPALAGVTLHHAWLRIAMGPVPQAIAVSHTVPLDLE